MANRMEAMKAKAQAMKSKAAEAGKAKQTAMAAREAQVAKAGERLKAENATMSQEGKARIAAAQRDSAAKANAQKSAMAGQAKPYTDALDRAIQAKKPAMPARPMGGGMGSMAGRGGMGARPTSTARPAMTPQVKQGLLDMSNKLRGMPMKRGGATKAKKK